MSQEDLEAASAAYGFPRGARWYKPLDGFGTTRSGYQTDYSGAGAVDDDMCVSMEGWESQASDLHGICAIESEFHDSEEEEEEAVVGAAVELAGMNRPGILKKDKHTSETTT